MYRIHTSLCSLREHLTWKRDGASQQNEETSEMPAESSNETCTIIAEEEESQEAIDGSDGNDHIIDTFDTELPPHYAPPELNTRERIQNGFFKLMSPSKKLRQDVEKLQMSIMYPPGAMPLNPIVELDEQAPDSHNDGDIFSVRNRKSFFKTAFDTAVLNATRLKLFFNQSTDTPNTYGNGFYYVFYAAPGKFMYLCHQLL